MNEVNEKENTIIDEELKKDVSKRKINKRNIKKFIVGTALLASLAGGIGGICVYDAQIDHTEEICKISSVLNSLSPWNAIPSGYVNHQIPAMKKEYEEKGIENADVEYTIGLVRTEIEETVTPTKNVKYAVPAGYTVAKDENGNLIGVKGQYIIVSEDEQLPQGYTLISTDEFGNQYGVKYIYVPANEEIFYSVPSGYSIEKDEMGNIIGVKKIVQEEFCNGFHIFTGNYALEFVPENSLIRNR